MARAHRACHRAHPHAQGDMFMRSQFAAAVGIGVFLVVVQPTFAHHSFSAEFDANNRRITPAPPEPPSPANSR